MRSFLFALVATVGMFSLTSMAEAGGCRRGGGYGFGGFHGGYRAPSYNYHYGYSQYGCLPHTYHSWSRRCWFPRYNCYGYYCPRRSCWYYWYKPFNRYMPVRHMNQFQPTNTNININTNVNSNANSTLPTGATSIPVVPGQP